MRFEVQITTGGLTTASMALEEELGGKILKHVVMDEEINAIWRLYGKYHLLDNPLLALEDTELEGNRRICERGYLQIFFPRMSGREGKENYPLGLPSISS